MKKSSKTNKSFGAQLSPLAANRMKGGVISFMSNPIFFMAMLFRAVTKFGRYSHANLSSYAQQIHDNLAANSGIISVSPIVSLADQQTAIDAFNASILICGSTGHGGSRTDYINLRAARQQVVSNTRALTNWMNAFAQGDPALIALADMAINEVPNPLGVLPAPQNIHSPFSKHTVLGQYRLRWKKVKGAESYNLYTSVDSDWNNRELVMESTKTLAVYSSPSIPSGTLRYFWVTAVGAAGEGDVSDVCAARNK